MHFARFPCILEDCITVTAIGSERLLGYEMGRGLSLPYRPLQQQDWTFCAPAPERRTKLRLQHSKQLQARETRSAQRPLWLGGLAMPPGVRERTPGLRQCWTNHQGPQLQTRWGLWQTEAETAHAPRMRNSVPKKHMLFNNLPQSEQTQLEAS